ncbi:hypothetical protein BURK1_02356 [Burkholderiales bacterium]|nr:hypothetical protein BURK1_02356 [Burkholderiales bacterium]
MTSNAPAPLRAEAVRALRATLSRFGRGTLMLRRAALDDASRRGFADARALLDYHDLMLFVRAHPATPREYARAGGELARVAGALRAVAERGRAGERRALAQTGVAWSEVKACFGLPIARWLVVRHPGAARLDAIDDHPLPLAEAIAPALPPLQSDVAGGGSLDGDGIVAAFAGTGDRLAWLVRTFDALPASGAVRERLFEATGAWTTIALRGSSLSRTFLRGPAHAPFVVRRLEREVDLAAALLAPLPRATPPSPAKRAAIVDASRGTLAVLGRETDAMSTTTARDTELHRLGRGVSIALHAPAAGRRGALDAHVGFVLYRNGVPVAYGGGWPFAGGCRIGVNVFPAFRGGESAWLFAQVLRAYRQRFGVTRFVVEPSQYGEGSREGLVSGAFWFYWRLGFRPVVARIRALAEREAAMLADDPRHRAPIAVLRRFTASDLALDVVPGPAPPDPVVLAERASAWLAKRGRGDPARAEREAIAVAERLLGRAAPRAGAVHEAWRAWAPLLAQCDAIARWPDAARAGVAAVLAAKARDEFAYQRRLLGHTRLCAALRDLARG